MAANLNNTNYKYDLKYFLKISWYDKIFKPFVKPYLSFKKMKNKKYSKLENDHILVIIKG